ncbi:osteocalcin [Lepidochelys kempii]|uniref:osteocalcin n=1 Tax=Lepidochelys kempii TaxID=8472 RepID=UPI003C6EF400
MQGCFPPQPTRAPIGPENVGLFSTPRVPETTIAIWVWQPWAQTDGLQIDLAAGPGPSPPVVKAGVGGMRGDVALYPATPGLAAGYKWWPVSHRLQQASAEHPTRQERPAKPASTMKTLTLLTLLALVTLCLCHGASDYSNSANDSPSSEAFVSKQDSAEVVRRHKRSYVYNRFYDIIDPLEGKREICELNPDCDELADHIGFQEAYRRYYGAV